MYEYEDILQRLYENSENKYNRSYATINDFADADLILSIENIEGAQVAKDFVEEIMSTREYPVTHSELGDSQRTVLRYLHLSLFPYRIYAILPSSCVHL